MKIDGDKHIDSRGKVRFVNNFDMTSVVRMYAIEPEKEVIRAWQGHEKETKWFFVAKGHFLIKTVNISNNVRNEYSLSDQESQVLEIPGGHYNGFQALEKGSVLMVFSNFNLHDSIEDDYREDLSTIQWNQKFNI